MRKNAQNENPSANAAVDRNNGVVEEDGENDEKESSNNDPRERWIKMEIENQDQHSTMISMVGAVAVGTIVRTLWTETSEVDDRK